MLRLTRNAVECPIFGAPTDLSSVSLPTFFDLIKYFLWVRHQEEQKHVNRNLIVANALEIVSRKVEEIWRNASIPTISHQRIVALIKGYQKKRKDLLKPYLQRQNVSSYKLQIEALKKKQ